MSDSGRERIVVVIQWSSKKDRDLEEMDKKRNPHRLNKMGELIPGEGRFNRDLEIGDFPVLPCTQRGSFKL